MVRSLNVLKRPAAASAADDEHQKLEDAAGSFDQAFPYSDGKRGISSESHSSKVGLLHALADSQVADGVALRQYGFDPHDFDIGSQEKAPQEEVSLTPPWPFHAVPSGPLTQCLEHILDLGEEQADEELGYPTQGPTAEQKNPQHYICKGCGVGRGEPHKEQCPLAHKLPDDEVRCPGCGNRPTMGHQAGCDAVTPRWSPP